MRLSGLQKDVLSLYRQCLRAARQKQGGSRKHFEQFARAEFNKYRKVEKRDFATIEYFLRKGTKQLELYSEAAIKDVR
ncbi:Succinate dehydrogenase assembly factor 1, mitochondrial [Ceratocystis fimbriata CBS 114723]|uniref:Succinate dehydrogenase assembly factor 1, mitochondrial n=1 Tax=Ceratocystis fimbriata CBS 114723 TaxID=1035309 RepID=A0A2C5X9V4_9PEZI|nr:Succinate dehydrogenase assembly factor 1, mitochondrial [Ceratocystis fimbriata CBS 114723]